MTREEFYETLLQLAYRVADYAVHYASRNFEAASDARNLGVVKADEILAEFDRLTHENDVLKADAERLVDPENLKGVGANVKAMCTLQSNMLGRLDIIHLDKLADIVDNVVKERIRG